MRDQVESGPAEKVTRDVDTQVSEAASSESANERMSREADDSARASMSDIQNQCSKEQNDTSFSVSGLNAYLGRLTDRTTSIVLDRTGNAGNSTWDERTDAARRHRLAECMREKQK
jgi:hypothetical protein